MLDFHIKSAGALGIVGVGLILFGIFGNWDIGSKVIVGGIGVALIIIALKFR